jgi:hypothetical protein
MKAGTPTSAASNNPATISSGLVSFIRHMFHCFVSVEVVLQLFWNQQ